jgi:17beta-estradiol 17-dehydrogenase / very-long-chain 3-oxoacyl-CoA reductase
VADFSKSNERGFFDAIYRQLEDLDISLLVNNVGIDLFVKFELSDEQLLLDNIIINTMPTTILCRKLVPKMLARKHHSGIINVASLAAKFPHPYYHVYSATKAYVVNLT